LINSYALSYNNTRLDLYLDEVLKFNPFALLIKYFIEFEFNNIYQRLFEDIILLLTNKHTPEKLLESFFIKNQFIEKLVDFTINKNCFKFR
jgi:hypothetical protein